MCVCVHCSCQFVVNDGFDYTVHAVDPDTLVDWDRIEQVVSEFTQSSICVTNSLYIGFIGLLCCHSLSTADLFCCFGWLTELHSSCRKFSFGNLGKWAN